MSVAVALTLGLVLGLALALPPGRRARDALAAGTSPLRLTLEVVIPDLAISGGGLLAALAAALFLAPVGRTAEAALSLPLLVLLLAQGWRALECRPELFLGGEEPPAARTRGPRRSRLLVALEAAGRAAAFLPLALWLVPRGAAPPAAFAAAFALGSLGANLGILADARRGRASERRPFLIPLVRARLLLSLAALLRFGVVFAVLGVLARRGFGTPA